MRKKTALRNMKDGSIKIPIKKISQKEAAVLRAILMPELKPSRKNKATSPLFKSTAMLLMFALNWFGLFAIGQTLAYYNDVETSAENAFEAGSLDFALSQYSFESSIGLDEVVSKSTVIVNGGGMDFQYILGVEETSDEDGFCDALNLQAKLNGVEQYDGDLMSLLTSASTALGTWKFNIELPVDEASFVNGEKCEFNVVFRGWQTNIGSYGDGGFSDEEKMSFAITAGKMVVLNEFLPRPDGVAYGFDFGNDSSDMPQGEWVELYNNSAENIDLTGWYIRDATDGEGNKTNITVLNTVPAATVIGGKGWLVVYMNKPILNNTGDTVRLFDDSDTLIDSHEYEDNDFCEIEPSPGDENSTDASGECGGVPPNKSYARIPDGIGDWVDPIPTPGRGNRLGTTAELIVTQDIGFSQVSVSTDDIGILDEPAPAEEINTVEIQAEVPAETEENIEIEEVLPTEENNEAPADTNEPETVETPTPEETPPAEPENVANEPPQSAEEAIIEEPIAEPQSEPSAEQETI